MKYKCPNCGKLMTTMYCDLCEKSIPRSCAVEEEQSDIKAELKNQAYILYDISRKVNIMYVIMIISVILSLIGTIFGIVEMVKIANLFR